MHWNVIVRSHLASQCIKTMKNLEKIIDAGRSFLKKCNNQLNLNCLKSLNSLEMMLMHVFAPLLHCHELNLSRSLLLHTAVLCIESFLPWSFKLSLCRNHEKEDFGVQSAKFAPSHVCFKRQNFVLLPSSPISDFPSSLIADRPSLPMFLHKATMY